MPDLQRGADAFGRRNSALNPHGSKISCFFCVIASEPLYPFSSAKAFNIGTKERRIPMRPIIAPLPYGT